MITTILLSSLEKVFPDTQPLSSFVENPSIFQNETFNFQVAYHTTNPDWLWKGPVSIRIESPLSESITVRHVDLVPSHFPSYPNPDEDYYTSMPTLLPDALMPLPQATIKPIANHWKSLWFEVTPSTSIVGGNYPIAIVFEDKDSNQLSEVTFTLQVIPHSLPKQTLLHTEWFHVDCLSNFYKVPIFSEQHWKRIEQFMKTAACHGMNMILTPLFTPPLDTAVGGERPTVQLIDVFLDNHIYQFNFDKLERWIEVAQRSGFEYFEMSHLFTQWGATATPKIMGIVNGRLTQLFGWNVPAKDSRYKSFLDQLLPRLKQFLEAKGLQNKCYFHVSDEPSLEHLENYKFAKNLLVSHLEGYPFIDALSNLEFYQTGALEQPIPSNDHIQAFIDAKVPNLWTYYCCGQSQEVSNRFMALPSFRNRILGVQLFKYDVKGFLHWGYNFWNTQFSLAAINPFQVTDAGCAFPSGDAFLVYPGEDGPIESIRLKVFSEALQDLRAMQFLASLSSKNYVVNLIESMSQQSITFSHYPHSSEYILGLRTRINQEIINRLDSSASI